MPSGRAAPAENLKFSPIAKLSARAARADALCDLICGRLCGAAGMTGLVGSDIAVVTSTPAARATVRPRRDSALAAFLRHLTPASWAYLDFLFVTLATCASHYVLVTSNPDFAWMFSPWLSGLTFATCMTMAGLVFGLYEQKTLGARSRILVRTISTAALGLILAYACIFIIFHAATTRWLGLMVGLLYVACLLPLRMLIHETVVSCRRRLLCVGLGNSIRKVVALLNNSPRPQLQIVGYASLPAENEQRPELPPDPTFRRLCPHLGTLDQLDEILGAHAVDEVVVAAELAADARVGEAVLTCLDHRCRVTDQPTFVEKLLGEVPAGNIDAQWFLMADVQATSGHGAVKRIVDVLAAAVGLVLSLPLWFLVAIGIRLDSPGPVFFKQRRVGLHGRPLTIYKFRTMRVDAERDGARWADKNDARATKFGRFLRLSRLDELPQLWNILRGEMSLVGPRPERPEFVDELSRVIPHYRQRHLVKPGLTGWAQIHYGYGATIDDARRKLCFDLYYLKHRSVDLDFAIIIRTIGTFLVGAR